MSVVFAVGSEDAFSNGVSWCERFAEQTSAEIQVAVIGLDRKVLLEHVKSSLAEKLKQTGQKYSIQSVDNDPNALLEYARSVGGKTMFLPHCADGDDFEQSVFEKSPIRTVWLRAAGPPPQSADDISVAARANCSLATRVSENLLGLIPERVMQDSESDELSGDESLARIQAGLDQVQPGHVLLFGIGETSKTNTVYAAATKLVEENGQLSVALVRGGESIPQSLASRFKRWFAHVAPPMEREERLELAKDLELGSKPNLEFLGLISAASMLAAFGLLQDSAAVVIGAMLIAPLMTPILGAGMALSHGNRPLFRSRDSDHHAGIHWRSGGQLPVWLAGLAGSAIRGGSSELGDQGNVGAPGRPSPLDFCVGLVGGLAASYARTRSHLSAALAGAAIAAALVPPLSTAGLQLSFGLFGKDEHGMMVVGPLLLVTINVLTIMIGSSFMLWARGMRVDRHENQKEKWTVRMFALLVVMTLLVLVLSLDPDVMFPN